VAALGEAAIAGVGAAGTLMFVVMALTQVLGVSAVALISQAVGRKDKADANLIFNQSLALSALCTVVTLIGGYAVTRVYVAWITPEDVAARAAGVSFLYWFLPGMALQFALVTMGSALRGTGIVKPTMVVQVLTVLLNTALAPILIAGWGTGWAFGVAGAGLASSLSVAVGVIMLTVYFVKLEKYVAFHPDLWRPRLTEWRRMLAVGLPAGGEFALIFLSMAIMYWAIAGFGAAAQAGFAIGGRIMQSIFLPAMAIAFAAGPIAGQNYGARQAQRVRDTFYKAVVLNSVVMLLVTLFLQLRPDILVAFFTRDADVIEVGATFLRIVSLNFVAQGIVFTCSGMFQGLGDTRPALLSSAARLALFAPLVILLTGQPGFMLRHVWEISVLTVVLQAVLSVVLLRAQFRRRLPALAAA
jgi:putative MATE family efflux protein